MQQGALRPAGHPRRRGEHASELARMIPVEGPSSRWREALQDDGLRRARGARLQVRGVEQVGGTIPAGAESTPVSRCRSFPRRDHPRAGGEHRSSSHRAYRSMGPSPRGRGALAFAVLPPADRGTIPAQAGSTRGVAAGRRWARDHPRAGGEHIADLRSTRGRPQFSSLPPKPAKPLKQDKKVAVNMGWPTSDGPTPFVAVSAVSSGPSPRGQGAPQLGAVYLGLGGGGPGT